MKASFLMLLLSSLSIKNGIAQGASFGIKGGMNLSSINMDEATYQPGYQVGGFAEMMISRKFGLQTEALYCNQNSKIGTESISLTYFSIPVLVRYNLNSFINIQAGPQYTMLLESSDPSESISGTVKNKDIGLVIGIGIDMPMGFNASLRFLNALNSSDAGIGDISSDAVQLSVGFALLDFRNK
ncbi:MAG: PorT family protein [Reichenbachiella sp.]